MPRWSLDTLLMWNQSQAWGLRGGGVDDDDELKVGCIGEEEETFTLGPRLKQSSNTKCSDARHSKSSSFVSRSIS